MNAVSLQGSKSTPKAQTGPIVRKSLSGSKDQLFIERRDDGSYAVMHNGGQRASAIEPTQAQAISRAKAMHPDSVLLVERVRNTAVGRPDKWRKA